MSDALASHTPHRANMVEVDGNLTDAVGTLTGLKLNSNVSTIVFRLTHDPMSERVQEVVDKLLDLLITNRSIRKLWLWVYNSFTRMYLLDKLVNGPAGDNLESLRLGIDCTETRAAEASLLEQYVTRNRDLKRLTIGLLESGPAALRLLSVVAASTLMHLSVRLWETDLIRELGIRLGQCDSIVSLSVGLYDDNNPAIIESFLQGGISTMCSLRRLELRLQNVNATAPSIIDAIRRLVTQNGVLEHFALGLLFESEECLEKWSSLGQALCSVKSLKFKVYLVSVLRAILPHFQGCESLELDLHRHETSRVSANANRRWRSHFQKDVLGRSSRMTLL